MISVSTVFNLLLLHFIADFIFQTDKMAKLKSFNNEWLMIHVWFYMFPFWFFGARFALFNGIMHFITDYISSRLSSYYYKQQNRHLFFMVIGFDQLIHTVTLIGSYYYFNAHFVL